VPLQNNAAHPPVALHPEGVDKKEKAPPVLPTPTRPPGEPGGQYSPEQTILYHLTRAKAIARAFLCPILNAYN